MNGIKKELEKWQDLQCRFPASSWVNLWYAKILQEHYPEQYEQQKSHLLLSFFDRKRFHQFALPHLQDEKPLANEKLQTEETPQDIKIEVADNQSIININPVAIESTPLEEMPVAIEEPTQESNPVAKEETVEEGDGIIDNLIEKFSNDPPKIQFNPETHDENVNYGKSSCVENPEIISETLAILYAEQGYVGKAVKIYKKLSLHNPEKSCYFADQIKKLKSENK